ncbi:TIGR02678 family protein [Arthrobacter gengyunqii]|uniref:TIGR02678 family protein n=1 Tax=Arthrobacter gengyunqii TaxID=2886940 RepID=A0ABS8GJ81_9MICC|nr:TIGR02678 family protein [Arthrobacter gengyunqii]
MTASHAASERREAARFLLMHPVMTTAQYPEEMALVRRNAAALKSMFAATLGYTLVIEASFARLAKAPLPVDAPARPARRSNGGDFTPRAYTYLALVCAGLLSPSVGEDQVLLSQLVEQLRADAATVGISIDDALPERRALVAAIGLLLDWGVLAETDGTVAGWGEQQDEALLTINRSLLPQLLARPLYTVEQPDQLWAHDPDHPAQPRRDLRRRIAENPLVRREHLTEGERDALSRERNDITVALGDAFGLELEVRAEGALAYDTAEEITDVAFPGNGTTRQAALLLLDALVDTLRPSAGAEALVSGRPVPGVLATWELVADNLEHLAEQNARSWRSDVIGDLGRLRAEVVKLLTSVSLATATNDGLVLHPACARYRPEPLRSAGKPRVLRRLEAPTGLPELTEPLFPAPADFPTTPVRTYHD